MVIDSHSFDMQLICQESTSNRDQSKCLIGGPNPENLPECADIKKKHYLSELFTERKTMGRP